MSSDIRSILQRFRDLEESQTTPVTVKYGLNSQQKGVPQLPALFKPKHIRALGSKTDPEHPMKGMAVGANESRLAEVMGEIEEDMLSKVKKDLTHYLDKLEKKVAVSRDLKDKALDAVHKRRAEEDQVEEDPTTQDPVEVPPQAPEQEPTLPESAPVSVYEMDDGSVLECWGDDDTGYEIRNNGRAMPSKFRSRDHANMAVELFRQRRKQQMANSDQDYIEEK
jgi:hypothetical protein